MKNNVSKSLSILLLCGVLEDDIKFGGGSSTTFANLEKSLVRLGHKVSVFSPSKRNIQGGTFRDFAKESGLEEFPFILPSMSNIFTIVKAANQFDVIVMEESIFIPFVAVVCWLSGFPLIYLCLSNATAYASKNSNECDGFLGSIVKFLSMQLDRIFSICSRLAITTLTVTKECQSKLIKKGYRIDHVFSYRSSFDIFRVYDSPEVIKSTRSYLTENRKFDHVAMYCGRISSEKRIDLLIKTVPNDCLLIIVGDGPSAEVERVWSQEAPNVLFHNKMVTQEQLRLFYKAVDLVVSASDCETLGLTVLEGSICGTLCLVHNGEGFQSHVVHGRNGWLSNFDDIPATKLLWSRIIHDELYKQHHQGYLWDEGYPDLHELVINRAFKQKYSEISMYDRFMGILFTVFVLPILSLFSIILFKPIEYKVRL